jgi:hypothetical protein
MGRSFAEWKVELRLLVERAESAESALRVARAAMLAEGPGSFENERDRAVLLINGHFKRFER